MKQTTFNTLSRRWKDFQAKYNFGSDYAIRKPALGSNVVGHSKKYVPVYWPVLEADLYFPLHPMIMEILRGCEVGLWQITPNSWLNILGYIATSELKGLPMSFNIFSHLHSLDRVPCSYDAWYTVWCRPNVMTAYQKPSKWRDWRDRFLSLRQNQQ